MNNQNPSAEAIMRADIPKVLSLRGRRLALARAGWFMLAILAVGLFIASVPVDYRARVPTLYQPEVRANLSELGLSVRFTAAYLTTLTILFTTVCCAFGALIFIRRSDDTMALFVSLLLVILGTQFPNTTLALAEIHPVLRWLVGFVDFLTLPMFVIFFYIFPDGRFVPSWTVVPTLLMIGAQVLTSFFPDLNPFTAPPVVSVPLTLGLFATMLYAQTYRYLSISGPVQRQQTKWVVFGFAAALVTLLIAILLPVVFATYNEPGTLSSFINTTGLYVAFLLMPMSIGFAILRYRLWDIDVIINRTLVYATLTAIVVGLYVLLVAGIGALLEVEGNVVLSLLATGLIAIAFAPLHRRLQGAVNRLMYGERDDPYRALARLGERLEATLAPGTELPAIVQTVRDALRLPYAAVEIERRGDPEIVAAVGMPTSSALRVPLVFQGESVGQLVLAPRVGTETFSPADRRLLDDLARQAGVAVHAVRLTEDLRRLTADLQRSRGRLVIAREEERRRLRRDLHDDLAPTLAALALTASTAVDLIPTDPKTATTLVAELHAEIRAAVSDIRRLVYDLRPPVLDELGLVAAIRDRAQHYSRQGRGTHSALQVVVEAPERLPPLPAAVEIAAYRIVQEALNNVVRHSQARTCIIRLTLNGALQVDVTDDGIGLPENRSAGVGLRSMRERAEELGGEIEIGRTATGGTRVHARLPLSEVSSDRFGTDGKSLREPGDLAEREAPDGAATHPDSR